MLPCASVWNRYSLPRRRAESPVQPSSFAEDAEVDLRFAQDLHHGERDFFHAIMNEPAQPIQ